MKWKKEFVEHLNHSMDVGFTALNRALYQWQGSPFEDEKPKHPIELVNEKYPDGWCVEECNKVIYDLNSYYDSIFKGGSYFYGVKGINSYNDNIVFGTKITKSEYLQLTGREIKDEPTHINPELPNVPHYGGNNNHFEDIKIINHYNLNFNIGNVIKYVLRDKEDRISDLKKAVDYLNFEIKKYENK